MKFFIFLTMLLLSCNDTPQPSPVPPKILSELQDTSIKIFSLSGDINPKLVNKFKKITKDMAVGDTLLLYINSKGGYVDSAEYIINIMAGLKTICLADMAYSAAFEIFQHCTVRIYNDDTSLMTHHHFALFNNRSTMTSVDLFNYGFNMYVQEATLLTRCAARMNMSFSELNEKIEENNGEWYLTGDDIPKYFAADYYLKDLTTFNVKK